MAIYDNLPVFKESYLLLLRFIVVSNKMQRDFRYTLGEQIKTELIALCLCIYKANANKEKQMYIAQAREKVVVVKLLVRILNDTKQISVKQYAGLMDVTESVSKQLAQWEKYARSVEQKNKE
ncbi:MAG TPA: four helix bundle protein [Bacteroides graminisolvens]|jgi:hypothetical protein|nr:four helix bundle protein [Bacteroides graminisolvens]